MQDVAFLEKKRQLFRKYFNFLNPPQQDAVFQTEGPLLVLAGAGSGKTTVLVNRIANIILFGNSYHSDNIPANAEEIYQAMCSAENGPRSAVRAALEKTAVSPALPYRVLCITFTNKAANEFKERLSSLLGPRAADIWAGTFHSICVRILRRHIHNLGYSNSFAIYDEDDQKKLISAIMKRRHVDEKLLSIKNIIHLISTRKELGQSPEEMAEYAGRDSRIAMAAGVYAEYQKELKNSNALDFDDIILLTNQLFQNFPNVLQIYRDQFDYILVDEYQDTNPSQNTLIKRLGSGKCNVCVVGDDDQSIYSFRGATVENILRFDETFPEAKTIRLEQNYRSTGHILQAANAVIANNESRKGKQLWTDAGDGDPLHVERTATQIEEAGFIVSEIRKAVAAENRPYSDFAVLYRVTALSNTIEQALVRNKIPYRICGGLRFNERREIKDVISYLSVVNNPADSIRLKRILNVPKRSIGDTTVAKIEAAAAAEYRTVFDVIEHADLYPELSKAAEKLMHFAGMIRDFQSYSEEHTITDTVNYIISESGYLQFLQEEAEADGDENHEREQNVKEFLSTASLYDETAETPTLSEFLAETALVSDTDVLEENEDSVTLMTVHSAKGLEFPVVFIAGFEDGIFPNFQAMTEGALEEERRLAYVAVTRAKQKLYLTYCSSRMLYGRTEQKMPSRFLAEIPEKNRINHGQQSGFAFFGGSHASGYSGGYAGSSKHEGKPIRIDTVQTDTPRQTVFKKGDRIRHAFFGAGVILSAENMGGDMLYEIEFDSGATKRIMGSFAKLKPEE